MVEEGGGGGGVVDRTRLILQKRVNLLDIILIF